MKTADRRPAPLDSALRAALLHALAWLVFVNAVGLLLALLLLVPALNPWLGEWTYGRWMMVHMNAALFGWASLPMLALLFRLYCPPLSPVAPWCRPAVWLWSAALAAGCLSWLSGHSSGKLFLDWSGDARLFFTLALAVLWLVLAAAFCLPPRRALRPAARAAQALGLLILLAVPFALYAASSPAVYPAFNPDTGGPTGQSQLESSLAVVLILLFVPFALAPRRPRRRILPLAWSMLAAQTLLAAALGRAGVSHRLPSQWLSLAALLAWIPIVPAYYRAFRWHPATRSWRRAMLAWWALLVLGGWILFLPGILDRAKFTDLLVAHSLAAFAGFLSTFLLFVLTQLLGEDAWILTRTWSFVTWNLAVFAYVLVIALAGALQTADPAFTFVPGTARNLLYTLRLFTGLLMLLSSLDWLAAALSLAAPAAAPPAPVSPEPA